MDALDFFRIRYGELHGRLVDDLVGGLAADQLRRRPHPGVNTIAWLLWHTARAEDVGVNRFVADRRQVFDEENWPARLKVERRDVGTGMDDAEVDELSAGIDLEALRGYWDAVARRTRGVVDALRGQDLDALVPAERIRQVCSSEGVVAEKAAWLVDFWSTGRSRAWYLAQLPLLHVYGHYFEARVVRGLWGLRSP